MNITGIFRVGGDEILPEFTVVIDGMTGVGKTSLLKIIAAKLNLVPYEEIFRDENDLLGKFFTAGKEWCFPMQISFLNNRFIQYKEALKLGNVVMDRSIYSDPIFASFYYKSGDFKPEEYYVYKSLFNNLIESLKPPSIVIYLSVSAEEAMRRIKKRGRSDELQVSDSYWRALHDEYSKYYKKYRLSPLLTINVDSLDFVNNLSDQESIVRTVLSTVKQ